MPKYTLLAINALIQALVLIFLSVALFVLAILAIFSGDFMMFVVLLSLNYILTHTAVTGATKQSRDLSDEIRKHKLPRNQA